MDWGQTVGQAPSLPKDTSKWIPTQWTEWLTSGAAPGQESDSWVEVLGWKNIETLETTKTEPKGEILSQVGDLKGQDVGVFGPVYKDSTGTLYGTNNLQPSIIGGKRQGNLLVTLSGPNADKLPNGTQWTADLAEKNMASTELARQESIAAGEGGFDEFLSDYGFPLALAAMGAGAGGLFSGVSSIGGAAGAGVGGDLAGLTAFEAASASVPNLWGAGAVAGAGTGLVGGTGEAFLPGGAAADTLGTSGAGITDEMLLTGQSGLGDLGVGTGTATGWSGAGAGTAGTGIWDAIKTGVSTVKDFNSDLGGLPGNVLGAGANYFTAQDTADKYIQAAKDLQFTSNPLNNPQRKQYQDQLSQLESNPTAFWETNPVAIGQLDLAKKMFNANSGRMGTGGTQFSDYLKNVTNAASGTFNDQAQLLAGLGGFNLPAQGINSSAQLTGQGIQAGSEGYRGIGNLFGNNFMAPQTSNTPRGLLQNPITGTTTQAIV